MKIALFGHGGMGRVLEESARAAGHDVGAIFTSANVGEAARLLPGHAVAIDFSAPSAVPAHVAAAAAAGECPGRAQGDRGPGRWHAP